MLENFYIKLHSVASFEKLTILQQKSTFPQGGSQRELNSHSPMQAGQASSLVTTNSLLYFPNTFSHLHGHMKACYPHFISKEKEGKCSEFEIMRFGSNSLRSWECCKTSILEGKTKTKISTLMVEIQKVTFSRI